ncbi:hypothetical protein B0H11DRAFT_2421593 [Mycena galericulata]|nr:hypothetical protein B0H11DRAFT_2421593 [Mycena galericulata]
MKLENFRLRFRQSEIDAQLLQIENPSRPKREENGRLKQERKRRLLGEKTAIQESLNRVIYPVLTIPVEITSEIFLHCLPDKPIRPNGSVAPLLLAAICQKWRQIVIGDSRLWVALKISVLDDHRLSLLRKWLLRGGTSMPLSICLVLQTLCERPFISFFHPESGVYPCLLPPLLSDSWERLTTFRGEFFTPYECLELLRRATTLIRCEFHDIDGCYDEDDPNYSNSSPLLRVGLQHLTLASSLSSDFDPECLTTLLDFLTLPELPSLDITCTSACLKHTSFISFLRRAPRIQTFAAQMTDADYDYFPEDADGIFPPILSALTCLTTFTLHADCEDAVFRLLDLFKSSESFLPHMQTLTFSLSFNIYEWEPHYTRTLIDALASRSEPNPGVAQLLDFNFEFSLEPDIQHNDEDDEDEDDYCTLLSKLWEFKERGMRLHVGPPEASWV